MRALLTVTLGAIAISVHAESRIERTRHDLNTLRAAVMLYHLRHGSYPPDLSALVETGELAAPLNDKWGRAYHYSLERPPLAPRELPYYLWTLGADDRPGGEHECRDRGNWEWQSAA